MLISGVSTGKIVVEKVTNSTIDLIITILNCIMVTNERVQIPHLLTTYGAEWGTGVLHSLQNCLRPACQVWWVRFPHSPANLHNTN